MILRQRERTTVRINRTSITQLKVISEELNEEYEELLNRVIEEGIAQIQPDFMLRNELMKRNTLYKMMYEIYPLLYKKCQFDTSVCTIFESMGHFLVDFHFYLYKRIFTESDFLVLSKAQSLFKYLKNNYPYDYEQIKLHSGLRKETKAYKLLFGERILSLSPTQQNTLNRLDTEEKPKSKFEAGYVTEGKYKKDDGTFGNSSIEFPPIDQMKKKYEGLDASGRDIK